MTRFIITKEKALELVFLSGHIAKGGEIFIFKMPAININNLADAMIEKYCSKTSKEIIGRKPGEKMYEELMTEEEMSRAYEGKDMYIILPQVIGTDHNNYRGYKKVKTVRNSRDSTLLTKEEIMRLI